jgi:hypothetical protein
LVFKAVQVLIIMAAMLSGCMPEAVKQIESNKSYMQSQFAVAADRLVVILLLPNPAVLA